MPIVDFSRDKFLNNPDYLLKANTLWLAWNKNKIRAAFTRLDARGDSLLASLARNKPGRLRDMFQFMYDNPDIFIDEIILNLFSFRNESFSGETVIQYVYGQNLQVLAWAPVFSKALDCIRRCFKNVENVDFRAIFFANSKPLDELQKAIDARNYHRWLEMERVQPIRTKGGWVVGETPLYTQKQKDEYDKPTRGFLNRLAVLYEEKRYGPADGLKFLLFLDFILESLDKITEIEINDLLKKATGTKSPILSISKLQSYLVKYMEQSQSSNVEKFHIIATHLLTKTQYCDIYIAAVREIASKDMPASSYLALALDKTKEIGNFFANHRSRPLPFLGHIGNTQSVNKLQSVNNELRGAPQELLEQASSTRPTH